MQADPVGDMSRTELRAFVEAIVDERIRATRPQSYKQTSSRPLSEVLEEMRQTLFVPPPGTPSVVEMLREDRDR